MRFTASNAAEMARRSHAPSSRRFAAPPTPEPTEIAPLLASLPADNEYAERLKRAEGEKLDALLACDDPKACASLARCIRELRETYHMVTGEPKPGVRRQERATRRWVALPPPLALPAPPSEEGSHNVGCIQ